MSEREGFACICCNVEFFVLSLNLVGWTSWTRVATWQKKLLWFARLYG